MDWMKKKKIYESYKISELVRKKGICDALRYVFGKKNAIIGKTAVELALTLLFLRANCDILEDLYDSCDI